jgi:hypothetical protein
MPVRDSSILHAVPVKNGFLQTFSANFTNKNRQRSILSAMLPLVKRFLSGADRFLYMGVSGD